MERDGRSALSTCAEQMISHSPFRRSAQRIMEASSSKWRWIFSTTLFLDTSAQENRYFGQNVFRINAKVYHKYDNLLYTLQYLIIKLKIKIISSIILIENVQNLLMYNYIATFYILWYTDVDRTANSYFIKIRKENTNVLIQIAELT